ncbi:MAG: hypothetical protein ABIR21_13340 [Chthoniobacterales bacterium]
MIWIITGNGAAVLISSTRRNVTIRNGHIRGTTTFAAGAFTTRGFLDGVANSSGSSANLRVSDLNVSGLADDGIDLGSNMATLVIERCSLAVCAGRGMQAGIIHDCAADTTGDSAISGDVVANCSGETVNTAAAAAFGVSGLSNVENCRGIAVSGPGVQGVNVSNSRGTSTSGNGLAASNAINCEGVSTSGSNGVNAIGGTASFCRVRRDGGVAIIASNAIGTGTVTAPNKSLGTP